MVQGFDDGRVEIGEIVFEVVGRFSFKGAQGVRKGRGKSSVVQFVEESAIPRKSRETR